MKIDGVNPQQNERQKINRATPVPAESFDKILGDVVSGASSGAGVSKSGAMPATSGVPFITLPSAGGNQPAVSVMEKLLTDLEMFRSSLGNGEIPLSRLSALADTLAGRKDELMSMLKSIPDKDLKKLVSEAVSVVIDQLNQYHTGYAA